MSRLTTLKGRVTGIGSRLKKVDPSSWRNDKTTAERGYGSAWQRARLDWLQRHPLCAYCARRTPSRVTAAAIVDHKTPHQGDEALFWDSNNWQSLCKPCHDGEKKREETK